MPKRHKHTVADRVQVYIALSLQPKDYRHIAEQLTHPNTQYVLQTCQKLAAEQVIEACGGGYFSRRWEDRRDGE